jgi:hypothetical protein
VLGEERARLGDQGERPRRDDAARGEVREEAGVDGGGGVGLLLVDAEERAAAAREPELDVGVDAVTSRPYSAPRRRASSRERAVRRAMPPR